MGLGNEVAEGKFGTVKAIATAFVSGFQPLVNGINQEIWKQQRLEVQILTAVATET
ncbi:hypothetical protein [Paenibacillus odorifer]|uniref:hypothetical protein n=1 Tax=Paenibacillus odorifer TaxID=189426 RepID=UPI0015C3B576|nr:hypothetical protein [Paenibacillus odorifer]